MNASNRPLGIKMTVGSAWLILMRIGERGIGLISTLVLVRLLVPADFGIVAMAMSLVALVETLGYFGLEAALIRNRQAERRHFDTVWTITVLYGVLSGLVLLLSAGAVSRFYHEPRLELVIYVLAAFSLIQSLENVGIVSFQKEMRFNKEFQFRLLKKLVGFLATVPLALYLQSYWALVIGAGVARIAGVAISYWIHPYRPMLSLACFRELWRFSIWMWLNNSVTFAATRGYDFIIGRVAGPQALGIFSVSYEVACLPTTEIVDPISRAIFPGFANLSDDRNSLNRAVIQSASIVALITLPLGTGLCVLAEPFVRLVLGNKWEVAIPTIQILALYGIMRAAHAGTGAAYVSIGRPRTIAFINLPHLLVGWPLMWFLLPALGLAGAGYGIVLASSAGICINFYFARKLLGIRFVDIASYYWRPILACVCMVGVEVVLLTWWPPLNTAHLLAAQLMLFIAAGAFAFISVLILIWSVAGRPVGAERLVLDWLAARFRSPAPLPDQAC